MTETPIKRNRRFRRLYSENVLNLMSSTKQKPHEVAELAKKRTEDQWKKEFGDAPQEWFPEPTKEN